MNKIVNFVRGLFEGIEGFVLLIMLGIAVLTTVSTGLLIWGVFSSFSNGYEFLGTVLLVGAAFSGFFWLQSAFFSTVFLVKATREALRYR